MVAAVVILVLPCNGWVQMVLPPAMDNRLAVSHISSLEVMQVSISTVWILRPHHVLQRANEQVILDP